MVASQKCQYALRAIFELGRRNDAERVKIAEIAEVQAIPVRFLEVILNELRHGGFVESRRGAEGGFLLARPASQISVGEIVRFIEGPLGPVNCLDDKSVSGCPIHGKCVFAAFWSRVHQAITEVYNGTTIQNMLDDEQRMRQEPVLAYAI